MSYPKGRRSKGVLALISLEGFFGVMGVISGLLLIADPSGALLGFTSDYQDKIPFQSFLPVGLFLLVVYGVGSFILAYGAWTRNELFFAKISHRFGRHWSWLGGVALIVTLVVWLLVEGMLIGLDFAATYFTALVGLLIFIMLMLPSVRERYRWSKF